jgi:hypothetical protein
VWQVYFALGISAVCLIQAYRLFKRKVKGDSHGSSLR